MEYLGFDIKNFKGIEHLNLDFTKKPSAPVTTLVGLNESGKTSVLEAISFFDSRNEHLESLYEERFSHGDVNSLVPLKKKANFNDTIEIAAWISLSDEDKQDIKKFAKDSLEFNLNIQKIPDAFTITRKLKFEKSTYKSTQAIWAITLDGKSLPRGKKERRLIEANRKKWNELTDYISSKLPSILYFPTFLFDFPERIYLDVEDESKTNGYYRKIIQDILDSLDDNLNIDDHIVNRALDSESSSRRSLSSVLNKMSKSVTSTVFERWNEIFDKRMPTKDIRVNVDVEVGTPPNTDKVYLEFEMVDGESIYLISERSLGFRWFFCFLLFTQFRSYRKHQKNTLFLLDEPASNLHSRAQVQLLESFSKITQNGGQIIYSTHSPYLINPKWLEGTFIVRNDGLKYEDPKSEYDYSSRDTDIRVERYREFVGRNADKETYFQPILDTLDYMPNKLEYIPNCIMVEGKNDYYFLKYFQGLLPEKYASLHILPGTGSGALDPLISMYLGWNRDFLVLLDDDAAGRKEKKRYTDEWYLPTSQVLTYQDINIDWQGYEVENLITSSDLEKIAQQYFPGKKVSQLKKKDLCRLIQEKTLKNETHDFEAATIDNFKELFEYLIRALP
jgi:predicted ATP-dependent endonuclease of OLD family|tara:strand:+ start:7750 stop:9600 length:1851 start_codon:yes stop_codon:yes gene_type:complete